EARFDLCLVEYSNDDGATWVRAAAYSGQQTSFTQAQVSLRALDGQKRARVRFRLLTDTNEVGDGWYIDDIRLTGRTSDGGVIPPNSTPAPLITSISPAFGPPAGGTNIKINGGNFTEDETTAVTFDGIAATGFKVLGGSVITAITPPHAAGA